MMRERSLNPTWLLTMSSAPSAGPWQAIFAPQFNTYYFYNSETKETTWENPLADSEAQQAPAAQVEQPAANDEQPAATDEQAASSSEPAAPLITPSAALQQAAIAQGIDPSLAYLDPSLVASTSNSSAAYAATAKFNAHTGQFARPDARDPTHLSEYERAKRMSEFYFDVGAWEKERAQDQDQDQEGGSAKKKKKLTKKDLVRLCIFLGMSGH